MGSLVTALASWVDARHHRGRWLLRIEDIDPPREVVGAAESIVTALHVHGLHWDGEVSYQSRRSPSYEHALNKLRALNRLYACRCTRKQLRRESAERGDTAYPGYCRTLSLDENSLPLRFRVPDSPVSFDDLHAGQRVESVGKTVGDFIVRRKDRFYAYQLAVVVDDAEQSITHVVRGADLLDNAPRQIALQEALGFDRPVYLHVPLMMSADGSSKLSKQTGATPLDNTRAMDNLLRAWHFLGQSPLASTIHIDTFLKRAVSAWNRHKIPKIDTKSINFESLI